MINDIFKDIIDLGVVAYMDNINIDSLANEEYDKLIKAGLSRL
jgi:hypothetical protein